MNTVKKTCWQLWRGELKQELCEAVVDASHNLPESDSPKGKIKFISNEYSDIKNFLWSYVKQANRNAFSFDITDISETLLIEHNQNNTSANNFYCDVDWESTKAYDNKLSIIVQLSDQSAYKGGVLSFEHVKSPTKFQFQKQGSILVFPSYLNYNISPITEGTRYSLISWFEGPRWR